MSKKNGGPAFPSPQFAVPSDMRDDLIVKLRDMQGMTLRDYFAAKAMQGTLAASGNQDGFVDFDDGVVAESCYQLADAMLKARGDE